MSEAAVTESAVTGEIVTVRARTLDTFGRFLASARQHHFVSDAKAAAGGPGDAVQAGELLLASLASCGLGLVQKTARERELPLKGAEVEVSFERDPEDGTRYAAIRLAFVLEGVDLPTARSLVDAFTGTCPIYNTLKRGGPIEATTAIR
ncbi:OsmC family protein [Variovorax saccharolyticus]|uniref:OsmC family protein n=1 Tax=Variovorax saccharolyticus TaxID=3053516 RepID=UPI002575A482|nr:OsmC family protein [Variovorax sp. J22R187]MDM0018705.1 OsmC family protein [Variovorax sp. J22R187]